MSDLDEIVIPRKTMVLFMIIDVSGSMEGSKIGSVNAAMEEVLPILRELDDENPDAEIKIAALQFSSGVKWITPNGPMELAGFSWNPLNAGGTTDLGDVCKTLNEKLSTKQFMKSATGSFAPAIFLVSDGEPTDNWQGALTELKKNNWFKASVKVALAIGDDANKDVLGEFCGSKESVIEVHNKAMLKQMIKFAAVTASQVASRSSNVGDSGAAPSDEDKQKAMNTAIKDAEQQAATDPAASNDQKDW